MRGKSKDFPFFREQRICECPAVYFAAKGAYSLQVAGNCRQMKCGREKCIKVATFVGYAEILLYKPGNCC